MRGIFCVDPGGHTGVAWAVVDETSRTTTDAMKNRMKSGSTTITGPEDQQIRALFKAWVRFKTDCVVNGMMHPDWIVLVIEDFVLRGGQHAGGRDGTMPERITWGFEGYRMGMLDSHLRRLHKGHHYTPIRWQSPSSASRFATRKRLEDCDAWIKGREHERTAFSHMILQLHHLLK